MTKKDVHVLPHDSKWAVKKENAERSSGVFNTQKETIEKARKIAKQNNSELLIHGANGKIRERNSYGNDPYPPKG